MAVSEVVGLSSLFEEDPNLNLFKLPTDTPEELLRLGLLLVSTVMFTEHLTAETILCSLPPEENGAIPRNFDVGTELCDDEVATWADKWLPYLLMIEAFFLLVVPRVSFKSIKNRLKFQRFCELVNEVLSPTRTVFATQTAEEDSEIGGRKKILDQRYLSVNYNYFLDTLKRDREILQSSKLNHGMTVLLSLGGLSLNIWNLRSISSVPDMSVCTPDLPSTFGNLTMVCVVPTRELNWIGGCVFCGLLILDLGILGYSYYLHFHYVTPLARILIEKGAVPRKQKSDLLYLMSLMDKNLPTLSIVLLYCLMDKNFENLWHCKINRGDVTIGRDSVTLFVYPCNLDDVLPSVGINYKIHLWVQNVVHNECTPITSVKPLEKVEIGGLKSGESYVKGFVECKGRLMTELKAEDFRFETIPPSPIVPDQDLNRWRYVDRMEYSENFLRFVVAMPDDCDHDICQFNITMTCFTSNEEPRIKSVQKDKGKSSQLLTPFEDLTPGSKYRVFIRAQTKFSRESADAELLDDGFRYTRPSPPSHVTYFSSSGTLRWINSKCGDPNHHYTLHLNDVFLDLQSDEVQVFPNDNGVRSSPYFPVVQSSTKTTTVGLPAEVDAKMIRGVTCCIDGYRFRGRPITSEMTPMEEDQGI